MYKTIEGIVDENGQVKLTEPTKLRPSVRVLVTVLDEEEERIKGMPITMLLSAEALEEWNSPEEDEAWKDFQPKKEKQSFSGTSRECK